MPKADRFPFPMTGAQPISALQADIGQQFVAQSKISKRTRHPTETITDDELGGYAETDTGRQFFAQAYTCPAY